MRYDSEHKSETRKRVLTEAARDIRAKGPGGIAVAGIMARAGLTHGGFYAHFKSKDDLIAEAIGTMFDDARARFDASCAATDPAAALNAFIDYYLSPRHRDSRDRGCPLPALSSDLARLDSRPRARFGVGVGVLTARLTEALDRHGIADADVAASSMLSELVGAVSLARAVGDAGQSDAILRNAATMLRQRFDLESAT